MCWNQPGMLWLRTWSLVHGTTCGRYHLRVGSTSRDLDPTELARLFMRAGREDAEDDAYDIEVVDEAVVNAVAHRTTPCPARRSACSCSRIGWTSTAWAGRPTSEPPGSETQAAGFAARAPLATVLLACNRETEAETGWPNDDRIHAVWGVRRWPPRHPHSEMALPKLSATDNLSR